MTVVRPSLASALVLLALTAAARADDPAARFRGRSELAGKDGRGRAVAVEVVVARAAGKLVVTRTSRPTSRRHRNEAPTRWTAEAREHEGALLATFVLDAAGASVGLGGALEGRTAAAAGPGNTIEAAWTIDPAGRRIDERLVNATRRAPETWTEARAAGLRLTADDRRVDLGRLALGGWRRVVPGGSYTVVVPTDGSLTLSVDRGRLRLLDPAGAEVARGGPDLVYALPPIEPALGAYTAIVEAAGSASPSRLQASFVQEGRIDARIRPWSVHTHYPVHELESEGGAVNRDALFVRDGPLDKLDRALGLTGPASAVRWERGPDDRRSFDFAAGVGHYVRVARPSEATAERDWRCDLDGDGAIDDGRDPARSARRFDRDADGEVSFAEALAVYEPIAVRDLFDGYDRDRDGRVRATELDAAFVRAHDRDGDGGLDRVELEAGARSVAPEHYAKQARGRARRLFARDRDRDGTLDPAELAPGAWDFMDSRDVDRDGLTFFDTDNVRLVERSGAVHLGNLLVREEGAVALFAGPWSDDPARRGAAVTRVFTKDVVAVDPVADGDLDDAESVSWWGHCNAWSMAAIVFRKPEAPLTRGGVTFSVRDQKGLLVAYGMGDTEDAAFAWEVGRDGAVDGRAYAAGFHRQLHRWLRVQQQGLMGDLWLKDPMDRAAWQVWNYPVVGYAATLTESAIGDPRVLDVRCAITHGSYRGDDATVDETYEYRLELDARGEVLEGEGARTDWTTTRAERRAYVRYLIHPFRFTGGGASKNPEVTLDRLEAVFGGRLRHNRVEELEPVGVARAPGR